jgi:hypothetical protein
MDFTKAVPTPVHLVVLKTVSSVPMHRVAFYAKPVSSARVQINVKNVPRTAQSVIRKEMVNVINARMERFLPMEHVTVAKTVRPVEILDLESVINVKMDLRLRRTRFALDSKVNNN